MDNLGLEIREVAESDLSIFFENECDPVALQMAAFATKDPNQENFSAHWERIMAASSVIARTIVRDGSVLGNVLSYVESDMPEVTYWIGREYWGQGVATAALQLFLKNVDTRRPIGARVAKDNAASIRVLEKCGFRVTGTTRGFADAREEEIDEYEMELK